MDKRLEQAQAALTAGRRGEAIDLIAAVIGEAPRQPVLLYRSLLYQHYLLGRHQDGVAWADRALKVYPGDSECLNLKGVMLRRLKRYDAAIATFIELSRRAPKNDSVLVNLGNVYNDKGDGVSAAKIFAALVRKEPRNADYLRQLGAALRHQNKPDQAVARFRQAVAVDPKCVDAWRDLAGALAESNRFDEAVKAIDQAVSHNPGERSALEGKAILLRNLHQLRQAETYLLDLADKLGDVAWIEHQLGCIIQDSDRHRALVHLRKAVDLDPGNRDYIAALAECLDRARGPKEPAYLEEAYQLLRGLGPAATMSPGQLKIANEVFARICAFDDQEALGAFAEVGRRFVDAGRHTALLAHMPRVKTDADRLELVDQHRSWGQRAMDAASRAPVKHPRKPRAPGKIRLGFMSSDLRRHPVAYFALPLFEHIDTERFEVYCYSFSEMESDDIQDFITSKVTAFRWLKDSATPEVAQIIADDQLDMLIELGGSTQMNKLTVMAFRAAPLQASWLGYPHSAGLETIDHLICDPYNTPERPELLIETPLVMPKTWIALGRQVFREDMEITGGIPQDRSGVVTFGTANNPYKYTREAMTTWARVMAKVPGSRMHFVRPECGSALFRQNISKVFADQGIASARLLFHAVRGAHMPVYNEIDISLDTFPLTGGTTTCEALWMGVPVVSLVGPAFYERLSYSILNNVGLGDLCADTVDGFIETAVALAEDPDRRRTLRHVVRKRMIEGPLGQTEAFARDFYDMIAKAVEAARRPVAV